MIAIPVPPVTDLQVMVDRWHNDNGCCKHTDSSVAEGVCCVCDAEAPCDSAIDSAVEAA